MSRALATALAALSLTLSASVAIAGPIEGSWQIDKPQTSLLPLLGGKAPFTPWGSAQYKKNMADSAKGLLDFDLAASRCSSPGLPRLMLMPQRFKIFEERDAVVFLFEWNRLFRQIDMRSQPYDTEVDSGTKMIGLSTGSWQGDKLVVTTNDLSDETLLDNAISHSDEMTMTESFVVLSPDRLEDTVTLTDPKTFIRPVTFKLTYHRVADEQFPEDVCLDRHFAGEPGLTR